MRHLWGFPYSFKPLALFPAAEGLRVATRVQPSPSWVPAGSLRCDCEVESSTQGFQRLLLSPCKEFSIQGCCFPLCLQMHHTLLPSCFPEGWTELLCFPQFPSCHTQPVATQGYDHGCLYLERKCLHLCGSPGCPLPVCVLAGDGWEPEARAGRGRRAGGNGGVWGWAAQCHRDALPIP